MIASLAHRVNARCDDDDDNNTNVDDSDYYKPRCGLTEIPRTIPPSTQNLDLSYNVIATIPIGVFSSLTQCEDLSLSNNRLTVLTQGMFTGLEMLESLYLSSNEISHIEPQTFSNLTTIMHLLLEHNKLTRLQRHLFSGLESLEELRLDHNEIIFIETGTFAHMPYLRMLGLSGNRLTLLSSSVLHQNNSVQATIHPVELELSLSDNLLFCNWRLSWLKEAEVDGWVMWFTENGDDHDGKPECYNYSDNDTIWDDLILEAMKAGKQLTTVADLHSKILDTPPTPIFFVFMQFSGKFGHYEETSAYTKLCFQSDLRLYDLMVVSMNNNQNFIV